MIDFTMENLYESLVKRPHVCILGAGASLATIPNGDLYGNKCPVMNNFIDTLKLNDIVNKISLHTQSANFEDIYSEIDQREDCSLLKTVLENRVINYFANLQLPDEPTTYDYLITRVWDKNTLKIGIKQVISRKCAKQNRV